jgi:RimJ/RimL family protein N-acetyltransferase
MIEGATIRLRPFTLEDVRQPHYLAWMNDPAVTRYLEAGRTCQDLASLTAYFEAHEWPTFLFLAIETLACWHIGNIMLGPISRHDRRAEVGIMIGEKGEWGKGAGTEAVGLMCQLAFDRLGLDKLTAGFVADNVGSGRVFFKNGFRIEGIYYRHFWLGGSLRDVIRVARFRESEEKTSEVPSCRLWQYWQTTYGNLAGNGARRYNLGSCPPRGRVYPL